MAKVIFCHEVSYSDNGELLSNISIKDQIIRNKGNLTTEGIKEINQLGFTLR